MRLTIPRFAVLLAIGLSIWFWPSVYGGKVFLPLDLLWQHPPHTPPHGVTGVHDFLIGDMLYENVAWKALQRRCWAEGELPLWNPYAFCGHPLYATAQASTFYPFNIIFLFMPLPYAYVVYTWLHLWLGGLLQYVFLRRIGVGEFGSAIGGVVFAFCGFFAMQLIWPMLLGSAIWLPLMLLCVLKLSECRAVRHAVWPMVWGAVIFALPLLSGFLEIAFYAYFVAGCFTLARCWHVWRVERSVLGCARVGMEALAVVALAVMLSGPQLLPFMEVEDLNIRAGDINYDKMVGRALKAEHVLPMIIPDFFGNPGTHHTWDLRSRRMVPIKAARGWDCYSFGSKNYSENGFYLGLLPLALAVLSLRARGQHRWFLFALLALSLAMAFGTRIYALFFYTVPGFDQVRTPFRWMYSITFAVASLAGMGADYWRGRLAVLRSAADSIRGPQRLRGVIVLAGPIALLVGLLVLLVYPEPAHRLAQAAMARSDWFSNGFSGFADAWDLAGFMWANFMRLAIFSTAAAVMLALPCLRSWGRRGAAIASAACLTLVGVDPGLANYDFNTHSEAAWFDRVPLAIKHLQEDGGVFRIARFGWDTVLHPNLPLLYGLHEVGGYDSIILSDYVRYLEAIEPQKRLWWNQIVAFEKPGSLDSPLLSLLNIRYLLTSTKIQVTHPDWELVFDENMRIYRNKRERPRAFMAHSIRAADSLDSAIELIASRAVDPGTTVVIEQPPPGLAAASPPGGQQDQVEITRYAHSRVETTSSSEADGVLVLCDMMYPGWRAYLDGRPAAIMKADGIFRGVSVPAGHHRVSFRFEPDRLRWGMMMSACSLTILVVALGLSRLTRASKQPVNVPPGK